jgi:hypothetical protein
MKSLKKGRGITSQEVVRYCTQMLQSGWQYLQVVVETRDSCESDVTVELPEKFTQKWKSTNKCTTFVQV